MWQETRQGSQHTARHLFTLFWEWILLIFIKERIQDCLQTIVKQLTTKKIGRVDTAVDIFMPKCCRTNVSNTFLKAWISNGSQDIKKHFWPMLWEVYPAIQEKPCKHPTKILWKNEDWMIVFSTQASKNFQRHWQSWASLQDWYKRLQASLRPLALMGWTVAPCPLFLILRARANLPFFL